MNKEDIKRKTAEYSLFFDTIQKNVDFDVYERAEDIYLYDMDGKRYLDMASQFVNVNIGYGNQEVIDSIENQLHKMSYLKPYDSSEVRAKLCEKLITELAPPNMSKVLLTTGGSDANDYAIRIAKIVTGKTKVLSQYNSYHGATIGAAQLSEERHRGKLHSSDYIHFWGYNDEKLRTLLSDENQYYDFLSAIFEETIILEDPGTIAAVIFDPIKLGKPIPEKRYFEKVREICDRYDIILIFDEVLIGFGRTGKWFAWEHFGIMPDIMTFAKGVTSSYIPLGGLMVSKKVSERLEYRVLPDGLTAAYHPAACAAAYTAISYMQREKIIENTATVGAYMYKLMKERILPHPYVSEIRGIGLMYTIHLAGKLGTHSCTNAFCILLKECGYLTWTDWEAVVVAPPLIITKKVAEDIIDGIENVLKKLENMNYANKICFYPNVSYGMSMFYKPAFIEELTYRLSEARNVLVLGSANENMLSHVLGAVKGTGSRCILLVNQIIYHQMLERTEEKPDLISEEDCVIFEHSKFDRSSLEELIQNMKERYRIDAVIFPYGRQDNAWSNISEVAEAFDKKIFMIDTKAGIHNIVE